MEEDHNGSRAEKQDLQSWMADYSIPYVQAVGMMTAAKLEDVVIVKRKPKDIQMLAIVTAGVGKRTK